MIWVRKDKHKLPPTENQVRAWLSWLAKGMQRKSLTIFQVEQIQPDWLSRAHQRWWYFLFSRLLQGLMIGLVGGFIANFLWSFIVSESPKYLPLKFAFFLGIIPGMFAGLANGLFQATHSCLDPMGAKRMVGIRLFRGLRSWLYLNLLVAVGFGIESAIFTLGTEPLTAESYGFLGSLLGGTFTGLFLGAFPALIWARFKAGRTIVNDVHMVESLGLSRGSVSAGLAIGLGLSALVFLAWGLGIGFVLIIDAFAELSPVDRWENRSWVLSHPPANIWTVILVATVAALIGGLGRFVQPGVRELKTAPNEGIHLSWRNASLMASLSTPTVVPLVIALGWEMGITEAAAIVAHVFLWYGGTDALQHYLLRLLLWRSGAMPWRYADFLDYAAEELHILQKVGGGYMFIHRYLLEHFAAMQPEAANSTAGARVEPAA